MNALDTILKIAENKNLIGANLKYCYVNQEKVPYNGPSLARPNNVEDFKNFEELDLTYAEQFAGIGFSIQASNICAIDIDHCFSEPFKFYSADERAQTAIDHFKDYAYIEFSFSGKGLRILFYAKEIINYSKKYYIKNSKQGIEYYYPQGSSRYVTITGESIINNAPKMIPDEHFEIYLNKYMLRPIKVHTESSGASVNSNLKNPILHFLRTNKSFQDNWFDKAPGFGENESERDFWLVKFIYENITTNRNQIKEIFEQSPFFKSKDRKHRYKWEKSDFRYFNYLYDVIANGE